MFTAMYEQYALNPEITRSRMYYEAISEILPGVKLFINTASKGSDVQMLLPLESLVENAG
jgi:membrane protease subunit HflK